MPRRSKSSHRKRGSNRQNHNHNQNQTGGAGEQQAPQISQATLEQAGAIAQKMLNNALSQGNSGASTGQVGGSAGADLLEMPQTGGNAGGEMTAPAVAQAAMTGGAIAGAVAASDTLSSLGGSPLMGGGRRKGRGRGKKRGGSSSSSLSSSLTDPQFQKGGMVPGLMTAVETALVPLGLYLGQKALQSRRSGNRSSSLGFSRRGRSFSRRTRRRGRR
jgi:hypothetical protein